MDRVAGLGRSGRRWSRNIKTKNRKNKQKVVKTAIFLEILGFFTKNNFLLLVNFVTPFRNPFSENDRFDLEFRSQILRN